MKALDEITAEWQEAEWKAEAERLKLLDRKTQRQVIAIHRKTAADKGISRADREHAGRRADALEKFLKLAPRKRKG